MECFRLLLEHLVWIKHRFLSGISDLRNEGSLWGMMRGVGGVRKSTDKSWLAKRLGLGLQCLGFKGVQERFRRKRLALFKSGQWPFHQDNAPVHNSILVTDYFTKIGINPYSPDLAPCDLCLFPKLRDCCYDTTEEMKECVTMVFDTLTQEDFYASFQKLLELYNKCIATGGDYFEGD